MVDFGDITSVLLNFNSGVDVCGKEGDADRNGVVNFADNTNVLLNYGNAYCPAAELDAPMARGGQGGGDGEAGLLEALNLLGYESAEAFSEALSGLEAGGQEELVRRVLGLMGL